MACRGKLLVLLAVLLALSAQLSSGQHWSHGWYPGGKRELEGFQSPEDSDEIKLCNGDECSYLRHPQKNILRSILADMLARQMQKKK
ncbi:progonadoliberin-2-like [Polyodon spathula]|uniref:progonadoliberin-2-like n=1 Tax=Polyodon spathula TaxID=7913 RepID=UPI001B7EDC4D|nr:progonadoliberin-2-like [Polyodon spathula]